MVPSVTSVHVTRAPSGAVFDYPFVLNTIILPQPLSPSIRYGPHQQFMEAARDHRPCLQGLCTQGFATAAFGVMVADRGVAFGHGNSYSERKG